MSGNKGPFYPKWFESRDGVRMMAPNRAHHQNFVDTFVDEEGQEHPMADMPPTAPIPDDGQRYMKLYPCGCKAGPGPKDMPDYCGEHGNYAETDDAVTIPYEEMAMAAAVPIPETFENIQPLEDDAGILLG